MSDQRWCFPCIIAKEVIDEMLLNSIPQVTDPHLTSVTDHFASCAVEKASVASDLHITKHITETDLKQSVEKSIFYLFCLFLVFTSGIGSTHSNDSQSGTLRSIARAVCDCFILFQ